MVQLQLVIQVKPEKITVHSNIMAREDGNDEERSIAKSIEEMVMKVWVDSVGGKVTRLDEDGQK